VEAYDRRIVVWRSARDLVGGLVGTGEIDPELLRNFVTTTHEALFLFDEQVDWFLSEVHRRAFQLSIVDRALTKVPVGESRTKLVGTTMENMIWLSDCLPTLKVHLKPYLSLE
jgi:hypothetical protein